MSRLDEMRNSLAISQFGMPYSSLSAHGQRQVESALNPSRYEIDTPKMTEDSTTLLGRVVQERDQWKEKYDELLIDYDDLQLAFEECQREKGF